MKFMKIFKKKKEKKKLLLLLASFLEKNLSCISTNEQNEKTSRTKFVLAKAITDSDAEFQGRITGSLRQ
jgi:hypothetical protein